ncbi:hypothetical protein RRF57_008718 [Xylaria bambusicola]|uniref:Berberine/berberine-like domain-containing protein n=1 Tax=Xylaria bambusicola TaxID=326684 RepID=A0AAN7V204_9PEZI
MDTSWFTLTFKSDTRIMVKASELHDELVHSLRAGGNIMGLEDNKSDRILFQVIVVMKTVGQHAFAYATAKAYVDNLREFAESIKGGLFHKSQDALASYGPENVKKMREAANKYDPGRVFQKLCPGGWKLSELDC